MNVIVYSLSSSEDGVVRYIGQTVQSLDTRLKQHISLANNYKNKKPKRGRRVWKWILSVLNKGYSIQITVIADNAVLHETEMAAIKQYRESGYNLVNATDGGEGTLGFKMPYMKRPWLSERNRQSTGCKRGPLSDEHKAKVSKGNKGKKHPKLAELNKSRTGQPGRPQTEAERKKRSETLKGRVFTEEHKAKLSEARKGRKLSPEGIAKLRAGHKRYHDERREAALGGLLF